MNTNSNTYTVIYTTVLVVVVAAILAIVSTVLGPRQTANIELEQMKTIMLAANIGEVDGQPDKAADFKALFENHIIKTYLIDKQGNPSNEALSDFKESAAFKTDLKSQFAAIKANAPVQIPVYVCRLDNGHIVKILPCYGTGLWGDIWGYISVKEDGKTIEGAVFAHASETPGLGGEIAMPWFYNQFDNKVLEVNGQFASIKIIKGGAGENANGVDAISGATITSRSLETAIAQWLDIYSTDLIAGAVKEKPEEVCDPENDNQGETETVEQTQNAE